MLLIATLVVRGFRTVAAGSGSVYSLGIQHVRLAVVGCRPPRGARTVDHLSSGGCAPLTRLHRDTDYNRQFTKCHDMGLDTSGPAVSGHRLSQLARAYGVLKTTTARQNPTSTSDSHILTYSTCPLCSAEEGVVQHALVALLSLHPGRAECRRGGGWPLARRAMSRTEH